MMNLLEFNYILEKSNSKEPIWLTQIEAEKIILLLSKFKKPQFIFIRGEAINTSFIVYIKKQQSTFAPEKRKITKEEERIHKEFLVLQKTNYLLD